MKMDENGPGKEYAFSQQGTSHPRHPKPLPETSLLSCSQLPQTSCGNPRPCRTRGLSWRPFHPGEGSPPSWAGCSLIAPCWLVTGCLVRSPARTRHHSFSWPWICSWVPWPCSFPPHQVSFASLLAMTWPWEAHQAACSTLWPWSVPRASVSFPGPCSARRRTLEREWFALCHCHLPVASLSEKLLLLLCYKKTGSSSDTTKWLCPAKNMRTYRHVFTQSMHEYIYIYIILYCLMLYHIKI